MSEHSSQKCSGGILLLLCVSFIVLLRTLTYMLSLEKLYHTALWKTIFTESITYRRERCSSPTYGDRGSEFPCAVIHMESMSRYILRDPEVYTDPLAFKPERYLEENGNVPEQDPRVAVFGFGRRYADSQPRLAGCSLTMLLLASAQVRDCLLPCPDGMTELVFV